MHKNNLTPIPLSQLGDPHIYCALHHIAQSYDFGIKVLEQLEVEHQAALDRKDSPEVTRTCRMLRNHRSWLRSLDSQRMIDLTK